MVPIYICEDEENIRAHFVEQINNYLMIENYDMKIVCETSSPHKILESAQERNGRGIYFFDVDLKNDEYNGFSLAKKIRMMDENGFIIFVTTHGELTFETFRHHLEAMDYIIKDDNEEIQFRINHCLNAIHKKLNTEDSQIKEYYTLKSFDTVHHIPIENIFYFETSTQKHRLIIHMKEEILEFFGSLSDIEKNIGGNFIRIHRSYLVNQKKIRKVFLPKNLVELENGEFCPIARMAKKLVKSKLEL